jgi:hypothetical protein
VHGAASAVCCALNSPASWIYKWRNRTSRFVLVDLARFERATSTFAESRSNSTELQVHEVWRKGQDSNLQATSAVVFKTTALPLRLPFRIVGACGRTRTYEGHEVRLIYSQVP